MLFRSDAPGALPALTRFLRVKGAECEVSADAVGGGWSHSRGWGSDAGREDFRGSQTLWSEGPSWSPEMISICASHAPGERSAPFLPIC